MSVHERIRALTRAEFSRMWARLALEHRPAALRVRCRTDRELFCRVFFPEVFNLEWSPVHLEFLGREKAGWRDRTRAIQRADLAPRGSSKTTLENFADLLHDAVYGLEVCTLVYSTTFPDSERMVKALHGVFTGPDANPLFHAVYGPFTVTGTQTEFAVRCPHGEPLGSQYAAKSFGGSGRGHLYRNKRPSKITMDDIVHPQHVYSSTQREKDWKFLNNDVLKSGCEYTIHRMLNTVQHPDDTTSRAKKDPSWLVRLWSAIIAWPTNTALWAECRLIWANLSDPDRLARAEAFYEDHRAAMDAGAEVLWPSRRPLFVLMVAFWTNPASFFAEDQNTPRDPTRQVFDVDTFRRFRFDGRSIHMAEVRGASGVVTPGRVVPLSDCDLARWLDPSLGKTASDFPALATVARERRTGYRFVLRCTLDKGPPSSQRARVWAEFDHEPRGKWGVDSDGLGAMFGEEFEREKSERQRTGRVWNLAIEGHGSDEEKHSRIARLESATANGFLQFADDLPQEVINQFRDEPHGSHDDAPDAIERADWLLTAGLMPTIEYGRR